MSRRVSPTCSINHHNTPPRRLLPWHCRCGVVGTDRLHQRVLFPTTCQLNSLTGAFASRRARIDWIWSKALRLCARKGLETVSDCLSKDVTAPDVVASSFPQVVVEAATRTAAMAQAAPLRNGRETKVLLTTREKGSNLIGTEPATCFSEY